MENILFSEIKLKNLIIEKSNAVIPSTATIINATTSPAYDNNGNTIEGTIAKIRLECIDTSLAKLLQQANQSLSHLKGFTVEIIGNSTQLSQIEPENLKNKTIKLTNARLALQWVNRHGSGGYSSLKAVIDIHDFIANNSQNQR